MYFAEDAAPLSSLGQYGLAGVILSIFFWFAWQVYKRERDRADENGGEVKRLNELIQKEYVPSLEKAKDALLANKDALEKQTSALGENTQVLAEVKAALHRERP